MWNWFFLNFETILQNYSSRIKKLPTPQEYMPTLSEAFLGTFSAPVLYVGGHLL